MGNKHTRRRFIGAFTAIATAASAGCLSNSNKTGKTNSDNSTTTNSDNPTRAKSTSIQTPEGQSAASTNWPMAFSNAGHTNTADKLSGPKNGFEKQWVKGRIMEQTHPAVLGNERIYYGTVSGLYARNINDGTKVWSRDIMGNGAPVITDTSAIFPLDDKLIALNPSNGERNWLYTPESGSLSAGIILTLVDGLTFVPTSDSANEEHFLTAIDTETGESQWTFKEHSYTTRGIGMQVSDGNNLYLYAGDKFHAIGLKNGVEKWSIDGGFKPTLNNNQIHLNVQIGDTFGVRAVNTKDGSTVWTHKTGAERASVPASNGDAIFTHNSNGIVALSASDGSELWNYEFIEDFTISPTVADGIVYAVETNFRIHAFAADTGEQIATAEFEDMNPQTAAIGPNNTIYVPARGGIYALSQ